MSLSKLVLEIGVLDGGSAALRRFASQVRGVGEAGRAAADDLELMADAGAKGLKALATAGEIRRAILDPGLKAAASLREALAGLEVSLDTTSIEETRRLLREAGADAARIAGPTRFSQEEVINVQAELIRAGLSHTSVVGQGGAAEAVAQLATGEANLSIENATDAVLAMGALFRLTGDQYTEAADMLSRASGASAAAVDDLQQSLAMAASIRTVGVGQEEALAALGLLGNAQIKGSAAGTALDQFLKNAAKSDAKYQLGMFNEGKFGGIGHAAEALRTYTGGMTDQERSIFLEKAFGDIGGRLAAALLQSGSGSFEEVLANQTRARGLGAKVDVLAQTPLARAGALQGTAKTTLANLFDPILTPLGGLAEQANVAVGALGAAAEEHRGLAVGVSGTAGLAVAGLGAYGIGQLARGGFAGLRGLRALGGLGGVAAGVASGKAVEAATGVAPVFVTNWPSALGGVGSVAGAAAQAGASAAGGRLLRSAVDLSTAAGKLHAAGGALAAAGLGWGIGTWINENLIKGTVVETAMQATMAAVQAALMGGTFTEQGRERAAYAVGELKKLGGQPDLQVYVNVDKSGTAHVQTSAGQSKSAASATGPS